jgi:hypothetical protein
MFLDAANDLFVKARLRVYGSNSTASAKIDINSRAVYSNREMAKRIVNESPKLKALQQVLEEIGNEDNFNSEINILIVANDDRTCSHVKYVNC